MTEITHTKRLLTPNQMRQAESAAVSLGVSLWQLMSNAGAALADFVLKKAAESGAKSCVLLCGSGNNGGDGFVCAEILARHGIVTDVLLMAGQPKTELAKTAFSQMSENVRVSEEPQMSHFSADIIVDCVFGTGFHGEIRENTATVLKTFANTSAYKIACDMPSGVDCSCGLVSDGTLTCDETLTFHAAKYGMAVSPAVGYCGKITVADIGIPNGWDGGKYTDDTTVSYALSVENLRTVLPKRPEHSHKGTFGKLLIIAGSESYIGAAAICSRAALHTGCGIVNLAAPKSVISAIAGHAPECVYTTLPVDENGFDSESAIPTLLELAERHDAIVVGCGLGQSDGTQKIVEALVKNVTKPLLIDADGINQLAKNIDVLKDKTSEIVLTPHIAELARIGKTDISSALRRRYEICRSLTHEYGVTIHSKDVTSLTFGGDEMYVTNFGCSALAKGGSGDMLAGIIGSLLAQGVNPTSACTLADFIMGRTAEILCEKYSPAAVTATDIIGAFKTTLGKI
jgi:NAD(P)H-hydrate epimerase